MSLEVASAEGSTAGVDSRADARHRVLVTTARPGSFVEGDRVLLLGPWCLDSAEEVQRARHHPEPASVAPYHWDDRQKLARDYEYLQQLHHKLLDVLTDALNRYHGRTCSRRYWQIIVDPWLFAYLGIHFDRWECLRQVFASGERFATLLPSEPLAIEPTFSYVRLIEQSMSDEWNFRLCARMLHYRYADRLLARAESAEAIQHRSPAGGDASPTRSLKHTLANWVDAALAPLSRRNSVVFLGSYFSPRALARLSWRLRLVPRLHLQDFVAIESAAGLAADAGGHDRSRIRLNFTPANEFERYLVAHIAADLPASSVEHYRALATRSRALRLRPKVIVTAGAHWTNVTAKAWMAEAAEAGAKLLVLNHGGSIPALREFFDFDDDISDVRGTWFKATRARQVQLPPSKLVGRTPDEVRSQAADATAQYCVVVGNEYPKWTIRIHFCPMADQCLRSFEQTAEMIEKLQGPVTEAVRIRPAPSMGWNLARSYGQRFGQRTLMQGGPLEVAFAAARLIVCTYPETTFAEAIASGRPTILLYPEQLYERHPAAAPLIEQLMAARMVFHDAQQAAAHISEIWADPQKWWNSGRVRAARAAFIESAMRIDGDWLTEWTRFLSQLTGSARAIAQ